MDNDASHAFEQLRPRLQKIAYRMLGTVAEAEDVVQDAWLRWNAATQENIDNREAWLVTITTRLSIDRLRAAQTQREHYAGIWLSDLTFEVMAINAWNRANVAFKTVPGSADKAFGLDKANLA